MINKVFKWVLICSGLVLIFFVSYFITNKYFLPQKSAALKKIIPEIKQPELPKIEDLTDLENKGELSDVPAYPGAEQIFFDSEEKHRKITGAAIYNSNDRPTDVMNWYLANMPKYGWWPLAELMKGTIYEEEYKKEMREDPNNQAEVFVRGNRICSIGVFIDESNENKTRLNVSVVYSELAVDNLMGHGGDPHVELFLIYRYNFGSQTSGQRVNNIEDGYSFILPDGFSQEKKDEAVYLTNDVGQTVIIALYNDPPNYNFCKDEEQDCAPVGTNQNLKGYFSDRVAGSPKLGEAGDPDYDRLILRSEDKKRAIEIKMLRSDEPPYYDREAAAAVIQNFQFN